MRPGEQGWDEVGLKNLQPSSLAGSSWEKYQFGSLPILELGCLFLLLTISGVFCFVCFVLFAIWIFLLSF